MGRTNGRKTRKHNVSRHGYHKPQMHDYLETQRYTKTHTPAGPS